MLKKSMIDLETIMLREFGFIVHVDHPHKLVLNHLNLLHQGVQNPLARTRLMQEAFSLTNDRYALLTLSDLPHNLTGPLGYLCYPICHPV